MKKKCLIILFSIIFALVLITLTGCGSKKAITTEKFIEMAKKNNLEILNATDEFKNHSQVKKATAAVSNDEWQVEFYILDTKESAVGMFNTNKNIFDSSKSGVSSNFSVSLIQPGDSISYNVTVTNSGTLDAIVDSITISDSTNPAINYTVTGITEGTTLAKNGGTNTLTVTVDYEDSIESQPAVTTEDLTVTINYVQDL